MTLKRVLVAVAALGLVACEQAQMNGPVGGAAITVTELRTGNVVNSGQFTDDEAAAAANNGENWETFNPLQKSFHIGNHRFSGADKREFVDETLYVIEMAGGFDYYATGVFLLEPTPVQVFGSVHAIVDGAQLREANYLVTPVTEAAYQYVKDFVEFLSDEEIQATLDAIAPELVGDVDRSGTVDYIDVIKWNRGLHSGLLQNSDGLAGVTAAVSAGDSNVNELADAMFAANSPAGVAEAVYADSISDIIVSSGCGPGCHIDPGSATQGPFESRNIILPPSNPDHVDFNTDNFRMLVQEESVEYVLNKASATTSHVGGARLAPGSSNFEAFEAWLNLL